VLVLAFDTSSPAVTVALVEYDTTPPTPPPGITPGESFVTFASPPHVLAEQTEIATNRHGELLAPLIVRVVKAADADVRDLDAIGVGLGPGPFTGLRVGIVTAKAMGDVLGIPTYGECSLDVIASRLGFAAYDDENDEEHGYVVMSDARRKQVYWATYDPIGRRLDGPDIGRPSDLAASLRGRTSHLAGAGALLYGQQFDDFTIIHDHPYPSAAELGVMVAGRLWRTPLSDDLTPMYLRRPDAQPPGAPKKVTPA
jgi:tRNA threonylcarbamoyladenosine biosynthesis protein TsaB